jgi:hypothetical protein
LHIGSAKDNKHGIPRSALKAIMYFAQAVYFPRISLDAIMGTVLAALAAGHRNVGFGVAGEDIGEKTSCKGCEC